VAGLLFAGSRAVGCLGHHGVGALQPDPAFLQVRFQAVGVVQERGKRALAAACPCLVDRGGYSSQQQGGENADEDRWGGDIHGCIL